jgi:hypothetical protein
MSILDPVTSILRSALGVAERSGEDALARTPLHEAVAVEERLDELAAACHRAADSAERHVEVAEGLASSLPALTEAVTLLTKQLDQLLAVMAPLGEVERDVSRLEHLFGRHHHDEPPARS